MHNEWKTLLLLARRNRLKCYINTITNDGKNRYIIHLMQNQSDNFLLNCLIVREFPEFCLIIVWEVFEFLNVLKLA